MVKVKIEEEWAPKSNIYTRTWIPAGVPIATVTFIHGFGEHCSRYDHVFTPFAEAGIKVHSFDQRGFGKTGRKSGIIGHNETLAEVTKDIIEANKRVSMQGVPHFIMGHSMGGGLALKFASEHPEGLSGVIASAPLVGLAKAVSVPYLKKVAIQGLSAWIPWLTINQGINQKVLSRDPAVGKAYVEDPNVHSYISLGTANDLLTICDSLQANGIKKINIPVLIAHGTQDNLTCYETSKKFHDEHEHHDKEFLSLDGWFHELHNEPEFLIVVSKYIDWIKKHVK